jgi:hypothetical protein
LALMRLPSWIIVAAVSALVVLAAADALRSTENESVRRATGQTSVSRPSELEGVVVIGPSCASLRVVRLPDLVELHPQGQILVDCDGEVWSKDGTLYASCLGRFTYMGTADGRRIARFRGCAPAWREDGALGVIRDGALVVARRRGRATEVVSRARLAEELRNVVARPRNYRLVEIVWIDLNRFAAIVEGAQPWEQAIIVMSTNGVLELALTEYGAGIEDLRVSPLGTYLAFARTRLGREFVMMPVEGVDVPLPRIGNALNVAWSPDESHIAISTRTTTFVAETGSARTELQVPHGGRYLAWIS